MWPKKGEPFIAIPLGRKMFRILFYLLCAVWIRFLFCRFANDASRKKTPYWIYSFGHWTSNELHISHCMIDRYSVVVFPFTGTEYLFRSLFSVCCYLSFLFEVLSMQTKAVAHKCQSNSFHFISSFAIFEQFCFIHCVGVGVCFFLIEMQTLSFCFGRPKTHVTRKRVLLCRTK